MDQLTPKQRAFVLEYLKDKNATQAAVRAGYSEKTARAMGAENLTKPAIAEAIDAAMGARMERTKVDADWLLTRLAAEATADMADLYHENGAIKPVHEWPLIWRQGLVAGVKHSEVRDHEGNATGDFIVDIKISDRVKRLEMIGKHIGVKAFDRSVEVKGLEGLADRLSRAQAALQDDGDDEE